MADYLGEYYQSDDNEGIFKRGDSNLDAVVNVRDVTLIQQFRAGLKTISSDKGLAVSDVNGDGGVTIRDATLIQMKLAGIFDSFE